YGNDKNEVRISEMLNFSQLLDNNFKTHEILSSIQTRQKAIDELYTDYLKNKYKDEKDFFEEFEGVIDDVNRILTLIIFSECAAFNPHLILGRNIFTGNIIANPNSVAEEILYDITENEL